MLPVSLDYPFLIVNLILSNVYIEHVTIQQIFYYTILYDLSLDCSHMENVVSPLVDQALHTLSCI